MPVKALKRFSQFPPAIWIICFMCIIYGLVAPGFFTLKNFVNILIQASPLLIVAIGETIVILTEGIDLSVGYLMGLAGVVLSLLLKSGWPIGWAMLAGVLTVCGCGLINGIVIAKFGLPPFIATLGIGSMVYGLGLVFTEGRSIQILHPVLMFLTNGKILGINMSIVIGLVVFGIMWVLMYKTVFGRNVIALGGNPEALRVSGVNIKTIQIVVYGICGLLSAIAGILVASRTGSGYAAAAMGWDFDAIGATIIGGTSFVEGRGGIDKTILGVLLISILRNGLNVAGVHNMYQFTLIGLVVVGAIILDVWFRSKAEGGANQ